MPVRELQLDATADRKPEETVARAYPGVVEQQLNRNALRLRRVEALLRLAHDARPVDDDPLNRVENLGWTEAGRAADDARRKEPARRARNERLARTKAVRLGHGADPLRRHRPPVEIDECLLHETIDVEPDLERCVPLQLHRANAREHVVVPPRDRKSTRLNSSHVRISYAVFCLKKKKKKK